MTKKRFIFFATIGTLAVGLVLVSLFVPMVHIVGHAANDAKTIAYDKTISFVDYFKDNPFLTTDASEVYFSADGPIWMATGSILLNLLLGVFGVMLFIACIIELIFINKKLSIKENIFAKKIGLFTGWFSLAFAVFAFVSFLVTTMLSNGYAEFYSSISVYTIGLLGILIIILSHKSSKRERTQVVSKTKNSLGFVLLTIASVACGVIPFVPIYSKNFMGPEINTMWKVSGEATAIVADPYIAKSFGDFPFGLARWNIIAIEFILAFVLIYSIIGFCMSLAGKSTNWLSSRVKRWGMALLVAYVMLFIMVLMQTAVLYSTFVFIESNMTINFFFPWFFALVFVPVLPYYISTNISLTKK